MKPKGSLIVKFSFVFLLILALAAINLLSFRFFLDIQKSDAAVIDAAGRNRMLSQRIALYAHRVQEHDLGSEQHFLEIIQLHNDSFYALKDGGIAPGIADDRVLPPAPPELLDLFLESEHFWINYSSTALRLTSDPPVDAETSRMVEEYLEDASSTMLQLNNGIVRHFVILNDEKQAQLAALSLILIIVNVLVVVSGFYIAYTVLAPIHKLSLIATEVGKGNLDVRLKHFTKDELGELGQSINKMILNLKRDKENLHEAERRRNKDLILAVKQKTAALDKKLLEEENTRMATMNILEDVEESRGRLEEEDQRKNELFNITSHELKTPLVPIKGYLGLVLSGKYGTVTEKQRSALAVVERNANRLESLIGDVLDIARLQAGKMKLNIERIKTTDAIRDAVRGMSSMAKKRGISLRYDIKTLPSILADRNRIVQVVTNLVKNAIKFTSKGGVTVKAYVKNKNIVINVIDTGIGIEKEDQEKIFERFYQVDSSITRKFGGTGLGLPISRGIIINHGGSLEVTSTPKKGSTFTILLPIKSNLKIGPSYGVHAKAAPKIEIPVAMSLKVETGEKHKKRKRKVLKKKKEG